MLFKNNIQSLKGREEGKDIYILANAPSIKKEKLFLLKDKVTIGMNANPLLEQEFGFISQYYVVSDKRFLNHSEKRKMCTEMLDKSTIRVLRAELEEDDDKSIKNQTYYIRILGKNGFSMNLHKGYYFGATTTMLAIQLAVYLGAKNIYILGMDLKYDGSNPRFYKEDDVQEFDSFTSVQVMNVRNAYIELRKFNVNLYNCSQNSLLYPYLPFKSFESTFGDDVS